MTVQAVQSFYHGLDNQGQGETLVLFSVLSSILWGSPSILLSGEWG